MRLQFRLLIQLAVSLAAAVALAQTPAAPPAFEVASIKPAPPITPMQVASGQLHVGMKVDAAQVDIGFMSLADLIRIAYRVKSYQVSGPDWLGAQRFDIRAKLPEGATSEQVPEMLQALLAERFKLTLHRGSKEHAVYALVVGKGGPKLKESEPDADAPGNNGAKGDAPKNVASFGTPNGPVQVSANRGGVVVTGGQTAWTRMSMGPNGAMHFESKKMTAAALSEMLSRFVDRPVIDRTELKSSYDIALDVSMEEIRNVARSAGMAIAVPVAGGDSARLPADAASDSSAGSVFASVQQLGLKLEPRKEPMETLFIDSVEKAPTEN